MSQQGQQPRGLAGRGRGHAQIGAGEQRGPCDDVQQVRRQIAVKRDQTAPGCCRTAQRSIRQRAQDFVSCRLKAVGIGNGGNQPTRTFDRHIHIGRKIIGPVDVSGDQAHPGSLGQQRLARIIAAHRGEQRRGHAEPAQGHGDIHRHAAGQPGDPARHVCPQTHQVGGPPDDVPQDRTDAQDIRRWCHPRVMARGRARVNQARRRSVTPTTFPRPHQIPPLWPRRVRAGPRSLPDRSGRAGR